MALTSHCLVKDLTEAFSETTNSLDPGAMIRGEIAEIGSAFLSISLNITHEPGGG